MDELFYSLLINFCVAGGLGFTNDYILEKLDVINTSDTNSKKFSLIFFSLVNFTIFYFIDIHLKNFYLSTIITFIISLALTFTLFWWTINLVRNELNFLREKRGLGHVEHRTVRKLVLDRNDPYFVYDNVNIKFTKNDHLKITNLDHIYSSRESRTSFVL